MQNQIWIRIGEQPFHRFRINDVVFLNLGHEDLGSAPLA
jgi:hypothetical protein